MTIPLERHKSSSCQRSLANCAFGQNCMDWKGQAFLDYNAKNEIVAMEVPAKQIAGILENNLDGLQKILEFVFSGNTLTIKVMNRRHNAGSAFGDEDGVVEDESMLDELSGMMDAHHPGTLNANEFVTEYAMPIEWIRTDEHLAEPSVPRPEHYVRPPLKLREFLAQLNYLKSFDIEGSERHKNNRIDTSKVYGEVRIVGCKDLEITTWAADTSRAHICHRDLGIGQAGMTATTHESVSARCMILIDPLVRSIQCLQAILEASMPVHGSTDRDCGGPGDGHRRVHPIAGRDGAVTMYLPAYLV